MVLQIADRVFMWTKSKVKESTHVRVTFDHMSKFLYDDVLIDIRVDLCFANLIILRVHLDRTYFAETENWKHCSKIIFKYVNSTVRFIFKEKVAEKWDLWVPWIVHGIH